MNTLLSARSRSHGPMRAAVLAAGFAVVACFVLAVGLDGSSLEAAESAAVESAG